MGLMSSSWRSTNVSLCFCLIIVRFDLSILVIMKTAEERKAILENEINKRLKRGWKISTRTETSCQFERDKSANGCLVVFLLLLFIIPGILYLVLYKGTKTLFVEVTEEGEVKYSSPYYSKLELENFRKD